MYLPSSAHYNFQMDSLMLFTKNPQVVSNIQHVLVDEYQVIPTHRPMLGAEAFFQDTNHVQYALIKAMARRCKSLTIVGDPDQVSNRNVKRMVSHHTAEYLRLASCRDWQFRQYEAR